MNVYSQLAQTELTQVRSGDQISLLTDCYLAKPLLVLVWPQLGDFDSLEYAWWLQRERTFFSKNQIQVRAVWIGDRRSGKNFVTIRAFPRINCGSIPMPNSIVN